MRPSGNILQDPMRLWAMVMSFVFIILGILILLKSSFLPGLPADYRTIFAVMLLIYGLFRAVRAFVFTNRNGI